FLLAILLVVTSLFFSVNNQTKFSANSLGLWVTNMKHSREILQKAILGAYNWGTAYHACHISDKVDIEIIAALYQFGYSDTEAEWIFRSKHLRWFYDQNNDKVTVADAHEKFTKYLRAGDNYLNRDIAELQEEEKKALSAPSL